MNACSCFYNWLHLHNRLRRTRLDDKRSIFSPCKPIIVHPQLLFFSPLDLEASGDTCVLVHMHASSCLSIHAHMYVRTRDTLTVATLVSWPNFNARSVCSSLLRGFVCMWFFPLFFPTITHSLIQFFDNLHKENPINLTTDTWVQYIMEHSGPWLAVDCVYEDS